MNKIIAFIFIAILLFCMCGCKSEKAEINSSAIENTANESLKDKLIREIDGAYLEEKYKNYEGLSTVDKCSLTEKYTGQWKQIADKYYNKMMEYNGITRHSEAYYSSENFHKALSNMKTNWENYHQVEASNYITAIQAIYNSGTICGPLSAEYEYEMQKNWALKLVGIYEQLNIK